MLLSQSGDAVLHRRDTAGLEAPTAAPAILDKTALIALTVHDNLDQVADDWRGFEKEADCTAFQTFAWHAAWQRHVGGPAGVRPAVVVGRDGPRILFLIPFAVEQGRFVRRLVWHASDLCDYNAPLLAKDFSSRIDRTAFVALFTEMLQQIASRPGLAFDAVSLTKMLEAVGGQPNPFMAIGTTLNPSGAYVTRLFGTWDTFYVEKRSSATRRRDRTKRKRLADLGEIRFVTPDKPAEIAATLATLMEQKASSFAKMGVPDLFARPGYRDFFREIATDPATHEFVHVSRLDVGTTPAAVNLGLVFGGVYYHVLASYDAGEVARFGPGTIHLHELMAYAIGRGCTAFDFTIGDERYKREWSDVTLQLHDHRCAVTLKGRAATLPSELLARVKRVIKQTPFLWSMASKARAVVGNLRRRGADHQTPGDAADES